MWHVDLALLIDGLETLETWTPHQENTARLVDCLTYWLNSEYSQWVTDPQDPEVIKAREERKRAGYKPPPRPIIQPVAVRPPAEHARAMEAVHEEYLRTHPEEPPKTSSEAPRARKRVSIKELQRLRGK